MPRIVKNRNNDDLLPLVEGHIGIGDVDEVNGPGAEEIPDFDPTRHELVQLLIFWANVHFEESFVYRTTDHQEDPEHPEYLMYFSSRRMDRIADLLEREEVAKVVSAIYVEIGKKREMLRKTFDTPRRHQDSQNVHGKLDSRGKSKRGVDEL